MRLFLHPNGTNEERRSRARYAVSVLAHSFDCVLDAKSAQWLSVPGVQAGEPQSCDAICTIGGDGTLLHASPFALASGKPVFGINLGNRGYLCAFHRDELEAVTPRTVAGLSRSARTLLSYGDGEGYALNDLVVAKGEFGYTVQVEAQLPCGSRTWQGDGLLIATPTGSSAYNASAGGPLLVPESPCFVLTPLCPVDPSPSLVVPDSWEVLLRSRVHNGQVPPQLYADGAHVGSLSGVLKVKKHREQITLLTRG